MMKYPKNCCGLLSLNDHECDVGCSTLFLMFPALVKFFLNSFLYWLSGKVFTSAPGSTFTDMDLAPCLVSTCNVVWKEVSPSDVLSVINCPSAAYGLGRMCTIWLT